MVGELAIDYGHRRVTVGGEAVDLSATEYELLRVLSLDAGRVVTFETLLRRVWAKLDSPGANLVRNFVRNLRRKLGESASSLPAVRAWRRLPHGEAAEPVRPGATEPRRPARPEIAALARDRDDGPLARVESHPATPAARQERPASTGTASCVEPDPRTVSTAAATSLWGSAASTRPRHRGGARDDPLPAHHDPPGSLTTPGAYPETGTPRNSRSAGSRTSKPSGTTSRKCHSNKHIPLISKSSGANPETGLSYPERPPPGS